MDYPLRSAFYENIGFVQLLWLTDQGHEMAARYGATFDEPNRLYRFPTRIARMKAKMTYPHLFQNEGE